MKSTKTKLNWFLILILPFLMTSSEASLDDDMRILIVGIRGDSRFSAADLLSGRKDGGQEDREIVKTPVISDEGRRMMLVTGPNLCEEDTARQSFTTALSLSSPGPHAVLMVLNLNDQESEQCDVVGRAQEMLGAEVLQHCIVLLHQNHQERFTGESRGIAGGMINACGGRFYTIREFEPKPAQAAALVVEIDKLVLLNEAKFHSGLNEMQQLEAERLELRKRLKEIGGKLEENQVSSEMSFTFGVIGCSLIISQIYVVLATEKGVKFVIFEATFAGLATFMASIRNALGPHVAFTLNLALCFTVAAGFTKQLPMLKTDDIKIVTGEFMFSMCLGVTLGSIASIRTFSDVFVACFAAVGVTVGAFAYLKLSCELKKMNVQELFLLFLSCAVGTELAMLCVNNLSTRFGLTLTTILIIIMTVIVSKMEKDAEETLGFFVFYPCCCVFLGSGLLMLEMLLSFLIVCLEYLLGSYLLFPTLLLGSLMLIRAFRSELTTTQKQQ